MSSNGAMASESACAKRRQILDGARQVFAEQGYERAAVDQIAARAGVSKATVYNHFQDKKALFVAAVVESCDVMRCGLERFLAEPPGDVEEELRAVGEELMRRSLSPTVVSLYRQAIAEAERMPEIGRAVFERGTTSTQDAVAAVLRRWHDAGALRIDDARAAAVAFISLCSGDLVVRMRLGVLEGPLDDRIRETVGRGVAVFVRAYR